MDINKRSYLKILRELKLEEYPSLDEYLVLAKEKIKRKEKLTLTEELLTFAKLKRYFEEWRKERNKLYVNSIDFSIFDVRPPLDFQKDGIKFLLGNDRCILADDMGLGKSIQSIQSALLLPEDYKILIITLKSLKYNFENEIKFFSDSHIVIEKKWESGYKFTIVHYESLNKWKKQILEEGFNCVIIDEAHFLKNPKVKRSKNAAEIIKNVEKVWLLTGTPINNRPIDYYNLLKLIQHPLSKNWMNYVETYCAAKTSFGHWDVSGASNLEDLYKKTNSSVLRRLKKDHIKDLPNKDRTPVFLHLESFKDYNNVIELYKEAKLAEMQEEIEGLELDDIYVQNMTKFILWRQYCALQKVEDGSLIEFIDSQLDEGKKVVVFSNFTKVLDAIYEKYGHDKCRILDGRIKEAKTRTEIVEEFNTSETLKVFAVNFAVGGVGQNITGASVAVMNDMSWVPAVMAQAEDRLWRIGQTKNVDIFYPVYQDTVEEIVYNVINSKMKNISTIIEGKEENYFKEISTTPENLTEKSSVLKEIFSQLGF